MDITPHKDQLELAFNLRKDIQKDNFEYSYRGNFTHNIVNQILKLTDTNLKKSGNPNLIRKKVYFVMMECLQNVSRHQGKIDDFSEEDSGLFILQKGPEKYTITTGNLINTEDMIFLKSRLEELNKLDKKKLKEHFTKIITEGKISDKGGAGLGLIAIARRSGRKLLYDFREISNEHAYFYMRTEIPVHKDYVDKTEDFKFDKVKKFHEILNNQNILLNFNGSFDEDYIISFLSIIGSQVQGSKSMKEKVFFLMVQMLQNIVYYADKYKINGRYNNDWKPGIFLLSRKNEIYYLTAGNYIEKEKIKSLEKKINYVNNLSQENLDEYYKDCLFDLTNGADKKHELSIIEMRLKSENQLSFNFFSVDNKYAFFTIQTLVK